MHSLNLETKSTRKFLDRNYNWNANPPIQFHERKKLTSRDCTWVDCSIWMKIGGQWIGRRIPITDAAEMTSRPHVELRSDLLWLRCPNPLFAFDWFNEKSCEFFRAREVFTEKEREKWSENLIFEKIIDCVFEDRKETCYNGVFIYNLKKKKWKK